MFNETETLADQMPADADEETVAPTAVKTYMNIYVPDPFIY